MDGSLEREGHPRIFYLDSVMGNLPNLIHSKAEMLNSVDSIPTNTINKLAALEQNRFLPFFYSNIPGKSKIQVIYSNDLLF